MTGELGAKVPSPKPEIHPWAAAELMASAAQKLSFTSLKELSPVVSKVLKAHGDADELRPGDIVARGKGAVLIAGEDAQPG